MADPPERAARRPVIAVFTSHWLAMTGLGLLLTSIIVWACLATARLSRGQAPERSRRTRQSSGEKRRSK